jgi:hypothetical protein
VRVGEFADVADGRQVRLAAAVGNGAAENARIERLAIAADVSGLVWRVVLAEVAQLPARVIFDSERRAPFMLCASPEVACRQIAYTGSNLLRSRLVGEAVLHAVLGQLDVVLPARLL